VALFTIGHGTRSIDELATVLHGSAIELLVDVRRQPGSRRNPHFARESLEAELPGRGIAYEWWGPALGGRRRSNGASRHLAWRDPAFRAYADHMETSEFVDALESLLGRAAASPTAVMCAETLWWRCHRRLISDAAVVRGVDVVHLGLGVPSTHRLTPEARVDTGHRIVYDVGVPRELMG
jgi:uncharacterized protein (DUF488 family)